MRPIANAPMLIALISGLMLVAGCSRHSSDDAMAKDIQTKIAGDPDTRDSDVTVTARDGKVTLTGKVTSPLAQQRLDQIAHEEPGATGVDDQTSVQANALPTPEAATPIKAAPAPVAEKPKPEPMIVPGGTAMTVRVEQALSSKSSQAGQTFLATVAQPVMVRGKTAIPSGSTVSGTVVTARSKGRIKGEGELALSLTTVTVRGRNYSIQTAVLDSTVKGKGKRTAMTTGGGAAGGALIGGLAGGGKGAGIGALVGAGAGLVGGTLTGNKQVEIPAESALTFTLSSSLKLPPAD